MNDGGISNSGSLPFLQRMMQFSWKRNTLLADAAANLDDPGYQRRDVPVSEFQGAMKAARDRQIELPGAASLPAVAGMTAIWNASCRILRRTPWRSGSPPSSSARSTTFFVPRFANDLDPPGLLPFGA